MSIRVMAQVWANSPMKGSALLLELAIADFADDAGRAFPAVGTLAAKIRMSERQTHRLIGILERAHETEVKANAGPNGVNVYTVQPGGRAIHPSRGVNLTGDKMSGGVSPVTGGGDKSGRLGVTPATPKPSVPIINRADSLREEDGDAPLRQSGMLRAGTPEYAAFLESWPKPQRAGNIRRT